MNRRTSVLTLCLAGPLQAWGTSSRFTRRSTERAPTKSGVIGLLAAAQGRERDADLSDLAALRFAVRLDQPGTRLRDFQTARHLDTGASMPVSERFYLSDAVFVAAVEGASGLVDELLAAVRAPVFAPFLGRRSCPPSRPIDLRVHRENLATALRAEPWQASARWQQRYPRGSRVELEVIGDLAADGNPGEIQRDQPLSFDPRHRRYGLREIRTTVVSLPHPLGATRRSFVPPSHDPMSLLEG
ncbi:type I-E CRISPR-associated protein Cas5/CasD [Streptomyces sp. NPDC001770]